MRATFIFASHRSLLTAALAIALVFSAAACGGGGGSVSSLTPSPIAVQTANPSAETSRVSFTILWPNPSAPAAHRGRAYLSNSTASITISVNGAAASDIDNPNLSPGIGSAFTQSTTASIDAPVGNDTFVISAFDKADGGGNLLGNVTTVQTVSVDEANTITATLDGNLAKIGVANPASPFVSGTFPAFTLVGQSPQDFVLTPEDADGNIIISPGNIPALTLGSATPASISEAATTTTNEFTIQSHAPAVTVTFTAMGTNLAGTPVTTTFTVTTISAIYIANHGVAGTNGLPGPESVAIYPTTATANSTPIAVLAGSNTEETSIQYPAVDSKGTLYLSNQGPLPGTLFSPTSGFITVFDANDQNGNVAPTSVITGLNRPEGIAFDSSDDLFVMLERSIAEYGPSPTATSLPVATIGAPSPTVSAPAPADNTGVDGCYGLTVDTNGQVYGACYGEVVAFAKGSTGNVAPTLTIEPPGNTSTDFSSYSWLSVATDPSDNIYLPEANNNLDAITEYAAGANDSGSTLATVGYTATGSGFAIPWGIAIDTKGAIYVTNYAASTVEIFANAAALKTGTPTTTLKTAINSPFGIAVR